MNRFDVIVVGAGITGLASAYHIKKMNGNLKIAILDKKPAYCQGNTAKSAAAFRNLFSSDVNRKITQSTIEFYRHIQNDLKIDLGMHFNICERESPFAREEMKANEMLIISVDTLQCPLADRSETGRIAYCFMHACIRKVRWLSMKDKVPSGRGEFKPMEIPPATFEVGSSLRKLGEEATNTYTLKNPFLICR